MPQRPADVDVFQSIKDMFFTRNEYHLSHIPCNCEFFPGVSHDLGPATGSAAEGWIEHAVKFWRERQNEVDGLNNR